MNDPSMHLINQLRQWADRLNTNIVKSDHLVLGLAYKAKQEEAEDIARLIIDAAEMRDEILLTATRLEEVLSGGRSGRDGSSQRRSATGSSIGGADEN